MATRICRSSFSLTQRGVFNKRASHHWPESAKHKIQKRRSDAKAEVGGLVVMQEVILSEIPHQPKTASSVMTLKMHPFVREVTRRHTDEKVRRRSPRLRQS